MLQPAPPGEREQAREFLSAPRLRVGAPVALPRRPAEAQASLPWEPRVPPQTGARLALQPEELPRQSYPAPPA